MKIFGAISSALRAAAFVVVLAAAPCARADEPERELGVAVPYLPEDISTEHWAEPVNRILLANLCQPLLLPSAEGPRLNILASLSIAGNGTKLELAPARHAYFSGGRPLTARRLRASFRYLFNTTSVSAKSHSLLEQLSGASLSREASSYSDEPGTLFVNVDDGAGELIEFFTVLPIVDSEVAGRFGRHYGRGTNVACTGPFYIVDSDPGRQALLRTMQTSAQADGSNVTVRAFGSGRAALTALRAGSVELIALPTAEVLRACEEDPTIVAVDSPLKYMALFGEPWRLERPYWSRDGDESDLLMTDKIIIRRTLILTRRAREAFDLSDSYLP